MLLGTETMARIQKTRVIIFGVGGVGSWCAECLVRSGIGHLTIVDADYVCATNCNRQLMATTETIGQAKVDALRERLLQINPELDIVCRQQRYTAENAEDFQLQTYDYIVDAIDSLSDKADLILRATALPATITLISSMGAALRTDPFQVRHTEFWNIKGDALARALREKFKKQKTFPRRKFQCVYSEEPARRNILTAEGEDGTMRFGKVQTNGSMCAITATFGMGIAGLVIGKVIGD